MVWMILKEEAGSQGRQEAAVMPKITEGGGWAPGPPGGSFHAKNYFAYFFFFFFFLPWLGDAQFNVLSELATLSDPRVPFGEAYC